MKENINQAYKIARNTYYAVFAGIIAMALGGYAISQSVPEFNEETITAVSTLSYLFLVISIPLAFWLYNKKTTAMPTDEKQRFAIYTRWIRIRIFIIGLGLFINILLFYLFHSFSFLYAAGISATAILFCKPSKKMIDAELSIFEEDN